MFRFRDDSLKQHHLAGTNELLEFACGYKKIIFEVGFGNGENTSFLALKNPNALIVASEVYLSGIGSLLNDIAKNSLKNIKIFDEHVRELLFKLQNKIFDEIYIICPDPWPKARHHKRRLIKEDFLKTCLNKANICILHAPLFHPAMKNVAPVRKALGMKTFFNILGPLVNPCRPNNQLVGVYGLDIL